MNSVMSRSVVAQRFAAIRPAAQANIIPNDTGFQVPPQNANTLPPGIPTGTIVQQGSSITPQFIAAVVGVLIIVGGLAYYLTRSAPESLGTRERRVRRNPTEWTERARGKEREKARAWFKRLVSLHGRGAVDDLGNQLVLGDFDWRDWFTTKPSSVFMNEVDRLRIEYEEMHWRG